VRLVTGDLVLLNETDHLTAVLSAVGGALYVNGSPVDTGDFAVAYNAGVTYPAGAVVSGSNFHTYTSKVAGNIGNDPTTDGGVHWEDAGGFPNFTGAGSPEGVQVGAVGQSFLDNGNGALYLKVNGAGDTGWVIAGGNSSGTLVAGSFSDGIATHILSGAVGHVVIGDTPGLGASGNVLLWTAGAADGDQTLSLQLGAPGTPLTWNWNADGTTTFPGHITVTGDALNPTRIHGATGGVAIDDHSAGGINILGLGAGPITLDTSGGTGGITLTTQGNLHLTDTSAGGITITEAGAGVITVNGAGGVTIEDGSAAGLIIQETGAGAIHVTATGAGGVLIEDAGAGIELHADAASHGIVIRNDRVAGGSGTFVQDASDAGISLIASAGPVNIAGVATQIADTSPTGILIEELGTGSIRINGSNGGIAILANGNPVRLGQATDSIGFYGAAPVARPGAIGAPAGGAVIDVQARTAIVSILNAIGAAAGGIGITA